MPRSPNNTGAPVFGSPVATTFTYPAISEISPDPPIELPATEPATAQISYTISAAHMPTLTGTPVRYKARAILYFTVLNEDPLETAGYLYYGIYVNGVSTGQGASAALVDAYWHHDVSCIPVNGDNRALEIKVGDVITVKLWATDSTLTLVYHGLLIYADNLVYGDNRLAIWRQSAGETDPDAFSIEETTAGPTDPMNGVVDDTYAGRYRSMDKNYAYTALVPAYPLDLLCINHRDGAIEHLYTTKGFDGGFTYYYALDTDGEPRFYRINRITKFACQPLNIKTDGYTYDPQ